MEGKIEKINISLIGVLNVVVFLAFFFAKIFDKIDWSWWWVFSPLWIPFSIITVIVIGCGMLWIVSILISLLTYKKW